MKDKQKIKILAASIFALVNEKKGAAAEQAVKNFQQYLRAHHLQNFLPQIMAQLAGLKKQQDNIVTVKVSYRQKPSAELLAQIKKIIERQTGLTAALELTEDQQLAGGLKIKYQDRSIDLSIDRALRQLSNQLVN